MLPIASSLFYSTVVVKYVECTQCVHQEMCMQFVGWLYGTLSMCAAVEFLIYMYQSVLASVLQLELPLDPAIQTSSSKSMSFFFFFRYQ